MWVQALALDRRSSAARSSGWCGGIEIGVEAQSGDDADIISRDGTEEIDRGERAVSPTMTIRRPGSQRVDLQCNLTSPVQQCVLGERGLSA